MYNLFTLLPTEIIDYIWFLVHKTYTNNLKMTNAVLIRHERLRTTCTAKFKYAVPVNKSVIYGRNECYRSPGYYYKTLMCGWSRTEGGFRRMQKSFTRYGEYGYGTEYLRLWDDPSNKFVYSLQSIKFCKKKVLLYEKLAECLELSVDELSKIPKYKYTKNTKIQIFKHIMAL